jgi:16S rRNA (guanine527-N7)-methyltransferase
MESPDRSKLLEILSSSFAPRGFPLQESQASALLAYLFLLEKWNKKIRLTGRRDPVEIAGRLLPESLDFLRLWRPREGQRALEVGAGAGITGIPVGILFPRLEVVLVESQERKAAFLAEAVRAVGIGNFKVMGERVENLWKGGPDEKRGRHLSAYDAILCRAVAEISKLLPLVWPLLAVGGRVLVRQGKQGEAEFERAGQAISSLGASFLGEVPLDGGRIIALGTKALEPDGSDQGGEDRFT